MLTRLGSSPELGLATRLRIVTSVLAGLEHAHTLTDFEGTPLEVVHRDVSPHNVIVTYDGHVKVLDSGVAKTLAAIHQTRPGGIKGKLAYLSPEAIRGDRIDRRTDLFSVGVLLWEILAGRRLWGRKTEGVSGAWRLASGEAAPELPADVDVPPELRAICARALALNPAERYATVAALAGDLERVGVDATEADARRLGRLASQTFAAELAQRRALIELHLRPASRVERGATFDYEIFEVSLPEDTTSVHERRAAEPVPTAPPPSPAFTSPAEPARTRRGLGRTLLATAAVAAVALTSGVYLGGHGLPTLFRWSAPASTLAVSPLPRLEPPLVGTLDTATIVEPSPEARESHASAAHEHRDRHATEARRARALDLLSDDVLDLDGQPFAAPSGSSATRSLRD